LTETKRPRREAILDAATELFAERGFEGTSLRDVAERVGVRKASLFHHFASKEALYEAAIDRLVADLQEPLAVIYSSGGTYVELLETLTSTLVGALGTRPHAARLLVREAMDWAPIARAKLLDRVLMVLEAGAAWVGAGQADGVFNEGDPKHIVLTALGLHFVPFALARLTERYVGVDPFDPGFVEKRRVELVRQTRDLQVRKPS
jgi:AcrR family transcriptional regulator